MTRFIDLSHEIRSGMQTYPGLPVPEIKEFLGRASSRQQYAEGTEFLLSWISMIGNTGTYVDTPFHRYADGLDLADLNLASVADLPITLISVTDTTKIEPDRFAGMKIEGQAVLFYTGWDRHFGTSAYGEGHPHLTAASAWALVNGGAACVGIDSLNIDSTHTGERAAHTALLGAKIPIVEHLARLDQLSEAGPGRFFAVPPRVRAFGTFPVRAFAMVEGDANGGADWDGFESITTSMADDATGDATDEPGGPAATDQ